MPENLAKKSFSMRIDQLLTDGAVLEEVGRRLERQRLQRNLTQQQLADLAGIGRATLQRMERGESVQSRSLVKLLRALGMLDGLEAALPESVSLPIAELERERRRGRRRATGRSPSRDGEDGEDRTWRWGDDAGAGS
jgi:transcriptional regulator with XRE-family HTH domain